MVNDIDRVKLLFSPPELPGNPVSSHLAAKQEELATEKILTLRSIIVHTSKGSSTRREILR
jgi:hypothetical protein